MAYEILVALNVTDEKEYQTYRDLMRPILLSYGGDFSFDFKVDEVLRSECSGPLNRVFTIRFPSKQNKEAFFDDGKYLRVKHAHFSASAENVQFISEYALPCENQAKVN